MYVCLFVCSLVHLGYYLAGLLAACFFVCVTHPSYPPVAARAKPKHTFPK
jgi:hypothetical protein